MSYIDPTNQGIKVFIDFLTSLSLPDGSNPGTRVLKSASVVTVPAAVKIEDTTGTYIATVKAPSTPAVAGDTALVVALSPNNPITITPSGTQNVNLTQVGSVAFSLGQQLAATSLPVVLTAAQIATLTPPTTVAVTQSTSPWVISGTVSQPSVSRTPSFTSTSTSGTVASGSRAVSVYNSGASAGTWLGTSLPSGVQLNYDAGAQSDTLGAFTYDATGTTFLITTIV